MWNGLSVIFVKDGPWCLVWEGGVGDTAQSTWQWSHQSPRPGVVSTVLKDRPSHVRIVLAELRLKLSVESLLQSVALVSVAVGHAHTTCQLGQTLSTGGLGGQSWPDKKQNKINEKKL